MSFLWKKYEILCIYFGKKGFLEENTLEHHLNIASSYNINQCEIACNAMHFLLRAVPEINTWGGREAPLKFTNHP